MDAQNPFTRRIVLDGNQFRELGGEEDADFEFLSPNQQFSGHVNLIPMPNAVQSMRPFYGSRFNNQALPLTSPEAPLVRTAVDHDEYGRTFEEAMGDVAGNVRSRAPGIVKKVAPDHILVETDEGEDRYELYNRMPFNRKTAYHNIPLVAEGDAVDARSLLARSNFTDDTGALAMGANARIGVVPYKGHSMDDATVISESFAKRLSSEHLTTHSLKKEPHIKTGLDHFRSLFPRSYDADQLQKMDERGVIKEGSIVNPGDPLILATRPKMVSSASTPLGNLSRVMRSVRSDASLTWDEDDPGEVTDVVETKDGIKVNVSAHHPVRQADKLTLRAGQKSYHPDTEVFTERGWVKIPDLLNSDKVAALFDDRPEQFIAGNGRRKPAPNQFAARFVKPFHANTYVYDGELYGLDAAHAAYLVTPNHRIWRKGNGAACQDWYCLDAQRVHGQNQRFMVRAPFDLEHRKDPDWFEVPEAYNARSGERMECVTRWSFMTWVRFMALYIAEGNIHHSNKRDHTIIITQKESAFCREVESTLQAMGMPWKKVNNQYVVGPNKALRQYLEQFGKAESKHVPQEIKDAHPDTIREFLRILWLGDGDKHKQVDYYTSSKRLADDVQQLLVLIGKATTLQDREPRSHQNHTQYTVHTLQYDTVGTSHNWRKAYYKERYHGSVYCLQVPGLGVILTRFRGKTMWNGNSTVARIIPDDAMPRTEDGRPLDMLFNQLGLYSRVNASTLYEMLAGKVAEARGEPISLPSFNDPSTPLHDVIQKLMDDAGVTPYERVFDPDLDRYLENPVLVGNAFVNKLHHTAAGKLSVRGMGSYTQDEIPATGGGDTAQAKRLSGLERNAMLASGAYESLREMASLRGARNYDYWRDLRAGASPKDPGTPLVWRKFRALLQGAGMNPREIIPGHLRLGPFTQRDLEAKNPIEITYPGTIDTNTLQPMPGGLFDERLTGGDKWGRISLPVPVVNPAYEEAARKLLGLTKKQFREIMAGREDLPEGL